MKKEGGIPRKRPTSEDMGGKLRQVGVLAAQSRSVQTLFLPLGQACSGSSGLHAFVPPLALR